MKNTSGSFEHLCSRLELGLDRRLLLNGQEMILMPLHFFRYILREVRSAAGSEAFERIFRRAGHDGAVTFCRRFQEVHGCSPREAVEGYLQEMSLRGWGQFDTVRLEFEAGYLEVHLNNSALAPEADLPSGNLIWEGAMLGVMQFLEGPAADAPSVTSEEMPEAFRIVVRRKPSPTGG